MFVTYSSLSRTPTKLIHPRDKHKTREQDETTYVQHSYSCNSRNKKAWFSRSSLHTLECLSRVRSRYRVVSVVVRLNALPPAQESCVDSCEGAVMTTLGVWAGGERRIGGHAMQRYYQLLCINYCLSIAVYGGKRDDLRKIQYSFLDRFNVQRVAAGRPEVYLQQQKDGSLQHCNNPLTLHRTLLHCTVVLAIVSADGWR